MIGRRVVVLVAVSGLGVLGCLGVLSGPAAAAPRRAPLVLHLKWRRVAGGRTSGVATNDRYVASVEGQAGGSAEITLIDEQTNAQLALSPPDCPALNNEAPPRLGGSWLMVSCGPDAYELYDLAGGHWIGFTPSPECGYDSPTFNGMCVAVGVGSDWVKLLTTFGCEEHCSPSYYLQNILTGELIPDPITPGGTTFDDLNSASGSVPLCRPLRYPTSFDGSLGTLDLSGPFALASRNVYSQADGVVTVYHLERCGPRLALSVPDAGVDAPWLGSRAVVSLDRSQDHCQKRPFGLSCAIHYYVHGVYLRGLGEFTAALPKITVPKYSSPGEVVGLTRRRIYVEAPYPDGPLWATSLPTLPTSR